ncbi:NAD(P)-dependent oxidoreductase [Streptomyces kronopolitis]
MEIVAFGVQRDERPILERAFAGRHQIRSLDVTLDRDTAPIAHGYEIVSAGVTADLGADVLQTLAAGGTKMIAQRATGFHRLALAVNRRLLTAGHRTRTLDFRLDGLMGRDLRGRTAGVLGTGRIGEAFAEIAHGFGMRLLGWDRAANPRCAALGMAYVPKERLFAEADLITLHVPLVAATHHLVDAAALAAMKDDAILVNSGRGGLVDTAALLDTLTAGRLTGVALDVYEEEADSFSADTSPDALGDDTLTRLTAFPHVLVTSHQAYFTEEAVGQIVEATVANVEDYLAHRTNANMLVTRGQLPAAAR